MDGTHGKSYFVETLSVAVESGRAVAVYADIHDFQSYEVGFVEWVDANETTLLCLTSRGESDGRRILRTDEITRVDVETAYTRRLELLHQYRGSVFEEGFRNGPSGKMDLRAQLEHAKINHTIVTLVDEGDFGPVGFVRHVGEDYVELERVTADGEPDGRTTIMLDSVVKANFGRRQDQVLEFLHRYNYQLKRILES
ncbi:hypothetical protein BH11ARM1_BH11ARM1_04270 [soil metagenome]